MAQRIHISEAEAERMADKMVLARLWTDRFYQRAENAEDQAQAEQEISSQVWRELEAKYSID